jgi:hypothetical protein
MKKSPLLMLVIVTLASLGSIAGLALNVSPALALCVTPEEDTLHPICLKIQLMIWAIVELIARKAQFAFSVVDSDRIRLQIFHYPISILLTSLSRVFRSLSY